MQEDHLDRELLERFEGDDLAPDEARRIERHLASCPVCRERADQASDLRKLELLNSWLYPGYDEAFERAAIGAAERLADLATESLTTEDLLGELLRETPPERRLKIRNDQRFHSLKLCQFLQMRSRESTFSDRTALLELADLAVTVSRYLDVSHYGSSLVSDCRALALGRLANALRYTSDLWRAEQALRLAWVHHLTADGDLSTETELLRLSCSLRYSQGRFDEAVRLIDRSLAIYREGQDRHLEGSALIHKGLVLGYAGRFREAVPLVAAGLAQIDVKEHPQTLLAGRHNLIGLLSRAGESGEARNQLHKSRHLYHELGGSLIQARLCWLDGQIALGWGRLATAVDALNEARDFFLNYDTCGLEVFNVSLDLAGTHAQAGQRRQVREVLDEVIPLGEALGVGRQSLYLARLLYEKASRA